MKESTGTFFNKIISLLSNIVMTVCMVLVATLVTLLFVQVIFRYALNSPLIWADELARFLLIWVTFLGAASAVWHGEHLGINYFINKFPNKFKKVIVIFGHVLTISFLLVAFMASFKAVGFSLGISLVSLPLSWGHAFISFPIGIGLCLVFYINQMFSQRTE